MAKTPDPIKVEATPVKKPIHRFQPGNKMSKGCPWNRQISDLRNYLFNSITKAQWNKVKKTLIDAAINGDMRAMQLLLAYGCGKPVQQMDVNMTASTISPEEAQKRIRSFFNIDIKEENE